MLWWPERPHHSIEGFGGAAASREFNGCRSYNEGCSSMKFAVGSWAAVAAAALASMLVAGCGGSDGGGTAPTPEQVVILDSVGRDVNANGGDGSSGVGTGDSGADGTAGEGAGIVGAKVEVTDVNGKTVSATTDAEGYYR